QTAGGSNSDFPRPATRTCGCRGGVSFRVLLELLGRVLEVRGRVKDTPLAQSGRRTGRAPGPLTDQPRHGLVILGDTHFLTGPTPPGWRAPRRGPGPTLRAAHSPRRSGPPRTPRSAGPARPAGRRAGPCPPSAAPRHTTPRRSAPGPPGRPRVPPSPRRPRR